MLKFLAIWKTNYVNMFSVAYKTMISSPLSVQHFGHSFNTKQSNLGQFKAILLITSFEILKHPVKSKELFMCLYPVWEPCWETLLGIPVGDPCW